MVSYGSKLTVTILVVALLASGIAGTALGTAPAEMTPTATAQDGDGVPSGELACAPNVPTGGDDPESDVMGWENGIWYNESIDVDQSDGVQADEQETIIARTKARVEAIRCIEFDRSVPVSVIGVEEYRRDYLERNNSEALVKFDNAKFEAMFLIGEDNDSIEVQRANRGVSILGFYDPRTDEIVLVAESAEALRIDEITLAHELVHAWQDQEFNINADPFDVRLRDDGNAIDGVVEGDAQYVSPTLYQRQCDQEWDCLDTRSGSAGDLANIGVYLLKFQPYSDGPVFVRTTRNAGGWDAVNDLYEEPPESTEQIIHSERYLSDSPTNVTIEDATTAEWERVRPPDRPDYGSVGESGLVSMFMYPYFDSGRQTQIIPARQFFNVNESTGELQEVDPFDYNITYTDGWDGDRLHVYEDESGEIAYVWRLAWDSPQDAQEFAEGYREVLRYWGGEQVGPNTWRIAEGGFADAFYVSVDGATVTIVNAPTVGQLSAVQSGIEVAEAGNATATNGTATNGTTTTA